MKRYFLDVSYLGKAYSGFQVQDNAPSIQRCIETALKTLAREEIKLTGSSRTDAGVHARQNYFHFDSAFPFTSRHIYNMNALLPHDIAVANLLVMHENAHCRFDALSRLYHYQVSQLKDPFLFDTAYHYPYPLNEIKLEAAANYILGSHDFTNYSKRNTQVRTFICHISESSWMSTGNLWTYRIRGNRFLRGMVRGLVGTMLKVATGKLSLQAFQESIDNIPLSIVDFAVPGKGLRLEEVEYAPSYFRNAIRL